MNRRKKKMPTVREVETLVAEAVNERKMFDLTLPAPGLITGHSPVASLSSYEIGRERVYFTWDLAMDVMSTADLPFERSLKSAIYKPLIKRMADGTYITGHYRVSFVYVESERKWYRFNGKHSSYARLEMSEHWHVDLPPIDVIYFRVPTMEVARLLYIATDNNRSRSPYDMTRGMLSGRDGFQDIPDHFLRKLTNGLLVCKLGVDYRPQDNTEATMHAINYGPLFTQLYLYLAEDLKLTNERLNNYLGKSGVCAFLLEVSELFPDYLNAFWRPVACGTDMTLDRDPRLWLRGKLETVKSTGRKDGFRMENGREVVGNEQLYWSCILMWNAWVRKREIFQFRHASSKPKYLAPG